MRRLFLGDESVFVESVLGRITLITLFTTLLGAVLALVFLVNEQISPVALKFVTVAALSLAAGLLGRRLLAGRNGLLKYFSAVLAVLVAFGVLNFLTRGFIGINLLRLSSIASPIDAMLQFLIVGVGVWMAQSAWTGARREVVVEPRASYEPEPLAVAPARQARPRRVRSRSNSFLSSLNQKWDSALNWTVNALQPSTGTRKTKVRSKPNKRVTRRRSRPDIALSAEEEHLCPYCLEAVVKRDPRGVKICKVCKTWHHADCWAITGVCQVPHQYVS